MHILHLGTGIQNEKEISEVWVHHISQSPNTSNKSPGRCLIKQSGNGNTIKAAKQQLKVKKLAK